MDATVTSGEAEVEQESGGLVIRRGRRSAAAGRLWGTMGGATKQRADAAATTIARSRGQGNRLGGGAGPWNMD